MVRKTVDTTEGGKEGGEGQQQSPSLAPQQSPSQQPHQPHQQPPHQPLPHGGGGPGPGGFGGPGPGAGGPGPGPGGMGMCCGGPPNMQNMQNMAMLQQQLGMAAQMQNMGMPRGGMGGPGQGMNPMQMQQTINVGKVPRSMYIGTRQHCPMKCILVATPSSSISLPTCCLTTLSSTLPSPSSL